jgi:hypothetical protein
MPYRIGLENVTLGQFRNVFRCFSEHESAQYPDNHQRPTHSARSPVLAEPKKRIENETAQARATIKISARVYST